MHTESKIEWKIWLFLICNHQNTKRDWKNVEEFRNQLRFLYDLKWPDKFLIIQKKYLGLLNVQYPTFTGGDNQQVSAVQVLCKGLRGAAPTQGEQYLPGLSSNSLKFLIRKSTP